MAPIANRSHEKISMKGEYRQCRRSWEQRPIGGSHNSSPRLSDCDRCTHGDPGRLAPGANSSSGACACIRFHLSRLHSIIKRTMHTTRNFTPFQNGISLGRPLSLVSSEHPVFAGCMSDHVFIFAFYVCISHVSLTLTLYKSF